MNIFLDSSAGFVESKVKQTKSQRPYQEVGGRGHGDPVVVQLSTVVVHFPTRLRRLRGKTNECII